MYLRAVFFLLTSCFTLAAQSSPEALLRDFDAFPHVARVSHSVGDVIDHEIGLGAMRKVRGVWDFKASERHSGRLTRYTWQVVDGYSSSEILDELEAGLSGSRLLFSCDGRSCGQGVQWANRVFRERLLYGRDDLQRYRVYGSATEGGADYRLLLFSSARTADRQYLHAEFLAIEPGASPDGLNLP